MEIIFHERVLGAVMFGYLCKTFFTVFLATVVGVAALFCVWSLNVCRLFAIEGERVFYLQSASSQGLRKTELAFPDFTKVRGESVRFSIAEKGKSAESLAEEITAKYGAEILRVEESCGVISYYAYAPQWLDGIWLDGEKINLHIAVSTSFCTVGTPIIFDGF